MAGHGGRAGPAGPARRYHGRCARQPGGACRRHGCRASQAEGRGARGVARPAQPGDRSGAGGGAGGELPVPRGRVRIQPGQDPAGLLPEVLALADRPGRRHHPTARCRFPRLRGRARPGHRRRPAGRHHGDRGGPAPLRRRDRGRRRRQRPADPARQDAVLRGQVLPHFHPGRAVAGSGERRRPGPAELAAADAAGQRRGAAGQHRRGDDRRPGAGADPAVPVPADDRGRPAADRHARRHRAEGAWQDRRDARRAAAARHPRGGGCSSAGRQPTPGTCATATSSPRRSPPPTGTSTSAHSAAPLPGRRHEHARDRNTAGAGLYLPAAA